MRSLFRSESIDLIYIDPPFFSQQNYNVLFGDQNELRSFKDIWDGGLNGFVIWLNARLYEMKRLLKPDGSIYVHLDWHAVHYVKVEMDKLFGYDNFVREIIWRLAWISGFKSRAKNWIRDHETLLFYAKSVDYKKKFNKIYIPHEEGYERRGGGENPKGKAAEDVWMDKDVYSLQHLSFKNRRCLSTFGYPTQKRQALIERVISASSNPGDVVADFFVGGGTTAAAAQTLGRRWIACDISRVAVSITADRVSKVIETQQAEAKESGQKVAIPDIEVAHWGVYEVSNLSKMSDQDFHEFVLAAFEARVDWDTLIHGYKGKEPINVGPPDPEAAVHKEQG